MRLFIDVRKTNKELLTCVIGTARETPSSGEWENAGSNASQLSPVPVTPSRTGWTNVVRPNPPNKVTGHRISETPLTSGPGESLALSR